MTKFRATIAAHRSQAGKGAALLAALALIAVGASRYLGTDSVSRIDPGISVVADLSSRTLSLREGGTVVETFPIAVGRGSMPTPQGNYSIRKIIWNPAWIPPDRAWARDKVAQAPGAADNPMRLVKIYFREPDYYIHGTNQVESLGEAASHGCLRMDPDDAYRVARYLMEHGGSPRDESWFQRVLHFRSESQTVYLDNPIPMTVTE